MAAGQYTRQTKSPQQTRRNKSPQFTFQQFVY